MRDKSRVIVTVAINGGMQQDRDGAVVPKQPEEIAEAAEACWRAGAAVVHVHARDPEGKNSGDPAIYSAILKAIRARCPILVQTTNGIGVRRDGKGGFVWPTDEERMRLFRIEPRQDLFGIALGTCDFHNPEGGYPGTIPYVNSPELVKGAMKAAYDSGSTIEFEVTEASVLHRLVGMFKDIGDDPKRENVWLIHGGGFGATPPVARNLVFSIDEGQRLFPQAIWGATATGRDMFWVCTLGLAMGCDVVRVGFEDGIHLANGKVARSNAEMVAEVAKIAAIYGRRPATVDEARETFRIQNQFAPQPA
jgi:3-keto-5-aminohexanoate cleavage enzyme